MLRSTPPSDELKSSSLPHPKKSIEHRLNDDGEVFNDVFIPKGVRQIIFGYWNNEMLEIRDPAIKKQGSAKIYHTFKFFGHPLQHFVPLKKVEHAANAILQGNGSMISEALNLVQNDPILLHIPVLVYDELKRPVEGKLIEIAAMARDFSSKLGVTEDEKMGLVERFALAGHLSEMELSEQLKVVTDKKAVEYNKTKNKRILLTVQQFMEQVLEIKPFEKEPLKTFQKRKPVQAAIAKFKAELQSITREKTTYGYIFDPNIICMVGEWFQKNIKYFGSGWSIYAAIFRVNVFGMLQKYLSPADANVTLGGLKYFIEKNELPSRNINESNTLYYSSRLGEDFYIDYSGENNKAEHYYSKAPKDTSDMIIYERIIASKDQVISKLNKSSTHGFGEVVTNIYKKLKTFGR